MSASLKRSRKHENRSALPSGTVVTVCESARRSRAESVPRRAVKLEYGPGANISRQPALGREQGHHDCALDRHAGSHAQVGSSRRNCSGTCGGLKQRPDGIVERCYLLLRSLEVVRRLRAVCLAFDGSPHLLVDGTGHRPHGSV